jgi:hypothetical protein
MLDSNGLILDETGDGGDSCNFTCWDIFLKRSLGLEANDSRIELFWQNGFPVRHPTQSPWNNPRNFSRDQAIPLAAVLSTKQAKDFYQKIKSRAFFLPNQERDHPGTRKYPFPHWFLNDHGEREFRLFDFSDPATPDFLGILIRQAELKHLTWFLPIARSTCALSIQVHCQQAASDSTFNDFKQLYTTAKILGLHQKLITQHPRGLEQASEIYFMKRRKLENLHELFLLELKKEKKLIAEAELRPIS